MSIVNDRRRSRLLKVSIGCVAAALCLALLWPANKEPKYNGRTLSEWVLLYDQSTGAETIHNSLYNPSALRESEEAVHHIGTNALPWLLKWIQAEPSRSGWRHKFASAADKLPWLGESSIVDWLVTDRREQRLDLAYTCFRLLGTNASAAVPELLRLLKDQRSPRSSQVSLYALAQVDQDGLPHLLAILEDTNAPSRAYAAGLFRSQSRLGTNADLAVRLLSACVTNKDQELATSAAESLGTLALNPEVSVPALAHGLQDPRHRLRLVCAGSLLQFGEQARSAVPALTLALQDTYWEVRVCATNALLKIARSAPPDAAQHPH